MPRVVRDVIRVTRAIHSPVHEPLQARLPLSHPAKADSGSPIQTNDDPPLLAEENPEFVEWQVLIVIHLVHD